MPSSTIVALQQQVVRLLQVCFQLRIHATIEAPPVSLVGAPAPERGHLWPLSDFWALFAHLHHFRPRPPCEANCLLRPCP